VTTLDCPSCADERAAGASFCEACGRPLTDAARAKQQESDPAACPHCGTPGAVGPDGYCGTCGMLAGRPRDHMETDLGPVAAAVTDRGKRHHRNEDAVFLAVRDGAADVVVCDGVSSSYDPDVASETAAATAGELLAATGEDPVTQVAAAVTAAGAAVAALTTGGDPRRAASNPACTIVAACVRGAGIAYGWIGDSRAYWVPADGPAHQLTEDDSWATHAIRMGADPVTAMLDPHAHAITGWLGADAPVTEPRTGTYTATAPGHLVVCSDGLWNYLPDPAAFAETVRAHLRDADLITAARTLTDHANERGGADNITVALVAVP
jgi:PPM family protein phosphatase